MVRIVRFDDALLDSRRSHLEVVDVCESPVLIGRASRCIATIGFRKDCFTEQLVDPTARGALRGDYHWKLYKIEDSFSYEHVTCAIEVDNNLEDSKVNEVLKEKAGIIANKMYLYEARTNPRRLLISDLSSSKCYLKRRDLFISEAVRDALAKFGIESLAELNLMSRSEVCRIPGMTTYGVFQLERCMASCNCFLLSDEVPGWRDNS